MVKHSTPIGCCGGEGRVAFIIVVNLNEPKLTNGNYII